MGSSKHYLVGDVGGTNCRLAACDPASGLIDEVHIMPVEDFPSLSDAIKKFADTVGVHSFSRASVSIANPIVDDRIVMTNAHWDFSIEETKQNCGLEQLKMLNDWESAALSLPLLKDPELEKINCCPTNKTGNRALCGVGTGLGAAGLVRGYDTEWTPIAGEGGHVSFSPINGEELQIFEIIRETHEHVSFEKILSGSGLVSLYQAIATINDAQINTYAPQDILAHAASQDDPVCKKTLEVFCGVLGNFAGNLCLTLGATGGIYIGGGVIQKIRDAGQFDTEIFLDRIRHKGRLSGWLNKIPAYFIKTPYSGLIGAAAALGIKHARVAEQTSTRST